MKKQYYSNSYYNSQYNSNKSNNWCSNENMYSEYIYQKDYTYHNNAVKYESTFDYVVDKTTHKKNKNTKIKRNYQNTIEYKSNNYTTEVVDVCTVIPKKIRKNQNKEKYINLESPKKTTISHTDFEIKSLKCYFDKFKKLRQNGIINDTLEIKSFSIRIDPLYKEKVESFSIDKVTTNNSFTPQKDKNIQGIKNQTSSGYQPYYQYFPFHPICMNMFYPGLIPPYAIYSEANYQKYRNNQEENIEKGNKDK